MKNLIDEIVELIVKSFRWVLIFVGRHKTMFHVLAYLVLLALVLNTIYQVAFKKEFTVYTGPIGTTGNSYAEEMLRSFNNKALGLSNRTLLEHRTQGFAENLALVSDDKQGNKIGFSQIGFGDMTNVRILLPLEYNYLFLVGSRYFYEHLVENCLACQENGGPAGGVVEHGGSQQNKANSIGGPGNPPVVQPKITQHDMKLGLFELLYAHETYINRGDTLGETKTIGKNPRQKNADKLRIAMGPRKSGAHELAVKVLQHFKFQFDDDNNPKLDETENDYYTFDQSSSAKQALEKLKNGELDLVFCIGPANFPLVESYSDCAFLIGLGEDAAAIPRKLEKPVFADTLDSKQFGNAIPDTRHEEGISRSLPCTLKVRDPNVSNEIWCFKEPTFCDEITVLKTRRVLICSKWMSKRNAYHIASETQSTLIDKGKISVVNWSNIHGGGSDQESFSSSILHEGAEMLRDGKSPGTWDFIVKIFSDAAPLLFFGLLAFFVSWANHKVGPRNGDDEITDNSEPSEATPPVDGNEPPDLASETVPPSGDPVTPSSSNHARYTRLNNCIERLIEELITTPRELSRRKHDDWKSRIANIDRSVNEANVEDQKKAVLIDSLAELKELFETEFKSRSR